MLTWWEGHSALGHGYGYGVIADEHYRRIATVHAGDGYAADLHEFALTSRGTALMTIYSPVKWDNSSIGGAKDGVALDGIVQEVEPGRGTSSSSGTASGRSRSATATSRSRSAASTRTTSST